MLVFLHGETLKQHVLCHVRENYQEKRNVTMLYEKDLIVVAHFVTSNLKERKIKSFVLKVVSINGNWAT
jgi:hypothetical protein